MIHAVLIAAVALLLNLAWLCVSLHRRVRSLEMVSRDQERRLQLLELTSPRRVLVGWSDLAVPVRPEERKSHARPEPQPE